jgi:CubicO group peptidase (beta-lactamase class C family)
LKTRTARTLDQPFRIASITKTFAATAVLILVDRGLLKKTDPIAKWYPQFPEADRITVDDLLRMRSGIPAPNDDEVLARVYDGPLAPAPSLADELNSIAQLKSEFKPPNTEGVYTDFNYDILAGIVQRVTGKDIGKLITENVIVPLKLHNTSYPTGTEIHGRFAATAGILQRSISTTRRCSTRPWRRRLRYFRSPGVLPGAMARRFIETADTAGANGGTTSSRIGSRLWRRRGVRARGLRTLRYNQRL